MGRKAKPKARKTMKFSELKRLSLCNSSKCPSYIEIIEEREVRPKGKKRWKTEKLSHFKWWSGIGWVDVDKSHAKNPMLVVNDDGSNATR